MPEESPTYEQPESASADLLEDLEAADLETAGGDPLASTGLLSFYDRLRRRILETVERRGGKLGAGMAKALLLVPDVFLLLLRLTLDKEVPAATRALIGGALVYFVLPMDLLPEGLLGAGGFADDLVLAVAILAQVFGGELEPLTRRHWSGPEDLRVVIRDVTAAGRALLGESLYERLRRLLARRGVELPEEEPAPKAGLPEEDAGTAVPV